MTFDFVLWGLAKGLIAFLGTVSYSSFFEWGLHKYLMHMRTLPYTFRTHALGHHVQFRADPTYHIRPGARSLTITFAWWNAPLLIGLHVPLLLGLAWLFGVSVFVGGLLALILDYAVYEYTHYCMHVPRNRWLERTRAFRFVHTHHYIHHRYHYHNLNVVNVLADWIIGSMRTAKDVDLSRDAVLKPSAEPAVVTPAV